VPAGRNSGIFLPFARIIIRIPEPDHLGNRAEWCPFVAGTPCVLRLLSGRWRWAFPIPGVSILSLSFRSGPHYFDLRDVFNGERIRLLRRRRAWVWPFVFLRGFASRGLIFAKISEGIGRGIL